MVKGGIRERFDQLRAMGIRTVMITGDNPLTAAAIAAEAVTFVADFQTLLVGCVVHDPAAVAHKGHDGLEEGRGLGREGWKGLLRWRIESGWDSDVATDVEATNHLDGPLRLIWRQTSRHDDCHVRMNALCRGLAGVAGCRSHDRVDLGCLITFFGQSFQYA